VYKRIVKYYLNKKHLIIILISVLRYFAISLEELQDALTPRFPNGIAPVGVFSAKIEGFFHTYYFASSLTRGGAFFCIKKP